MRTLSLSLSLCLLNLIHVESYQVVSEVGGAIAGNRILFVIISETPLVIASMTPKLKSCIILIFRQTPDIFHTFGCLAKAEHAQA